MRILKSLTLTLSFIYPIFMNGQGWEQIYDLRNNDIGLEIYNNPMGGYAVFSSSITSAKNESFLQLDSEGRILNRVQFQVPFDAKSYNIEATEYLVKGDFIVAGNFHRELLDPYVPYLRKVRANGQIIWERAYENKRYIIRDIDEVTDGGFIITGSIVTAGFPDTLALIKTDSIGEIQWDRKFGDLKDTRGHEVIQFSDNGYAVTGYNRNGPGSQPQVWLLKTNSSGELLWSRKFGDNASDIGQSLLETEDKGFIIAGSGNFPIIGTDGYTDATLIRTDSVGNTIWMKSYEGPDHSYAYSIKPTSDNSYIVCGQLNDSLTTGYTGYLFKIAEDGHLIWSKSFREGAYVVFESVEEAPDKGFILSGYIKKLPNSYSDLYVVKTDSLGNVLSSYIKGEIFWDVNQNCNSEASEPKSDHFIIQASGKRDVLGISDQSGKFLMRLDTGSYQIKVSSSNRYWEACIPQIDFVAEPNDTFNIEFAMQALVDCPFLTLSASTPLLRRCFPGVYTINYCNTGTSAANNVMIDVDLDSFLHVTSASIPYTISNNVYKFPVQDLEPGECGAFNLHYTLSCEASLGMTHCIEVSIMPDSICVDGINSRAKTKECQVNRGSFDPNDKRAFVNGIEQLDTISTDHPIEYQIRFQNTGTDTAFNVIIIDTIQDELDIYSVSPGSSSHPYEFSIIDSNIIRFNFKNIILPDSFINEPASNGYVKFMIDQKPQLPLGTLISNTADIYFDFNYAVATQKCNVFVEKIITNVSDPNSNQPVYHIYPNPISEILYIDIPLCEKKIIFRLFDLTGKEVLQSQGVGPIMSVNFDGCIPGLYIYQLYLEDEFVGGGTFIHR